MKGYKSYINKLRRYKEKKIIQETRLNILEPRMFKIALRELGSESVAELWRTNNCCESVCSEMGINYIGIKADKKNKELTLIPQDWSGDYILGYVKADVLRHTLEVLLNVLKTNQKLAIWYPYSFLESQTRYREIFEKNPFDLMLVTPNRPIISQDGDFSKAEDRAPNNGAWYIWQGTGNNKDSKIKWVEDELLEEYFLSPDGLSYVDKGAYANTDSKGRYGKHWIKTPLIQID